MSVVDITKWKEKSVSGKNFKEMHTTIHKIKRL